MKSLLTYLRRFVATTTASVPLHQPERADGESFDEYKTRRKQSKRAAQRATLSGPFNLNPRRF